MGVLKVKGLVLSEKYYGEADKMLALFTDELGKIAVSAKGARKLKSRYFSGTSQFDYSEFVLFEGKGFYSVTQVDKLRGFKNIAFDFTKLCYANYFVEMIDKTSFPGEINSDILRLVLFALHALNTSFCDEFIIARAFEFKLMENLGYAPNIDSCAVCGEDLEQNQIFFFPDGCLCHECQGKEPGAIKINNSSLLAIKYIVESDLKKIFSFKISGESREFLKIASDILMLNIDIFLNSKSMVDEEDQKFVQN